MMKLICIPYAGSSAAIYVKWAKLLKHVEIIPLELSGRGKRFDEILFTSIDDIVNDIYDSVIKSIKESEYCIFGYSIGAIIAYELIKMLQKNGQCLPALTFFASHNAPQIEVEIMTYMLPDKEFFDKVYELGGLPKDVIENEDIMSLYGQVIKSDYQAIETYRYDDTSIPIQCNCVVMYGSKDRDIKNIDLWDEVINKKYRVEYIEFNDGHFFINSEDEKLLRIIEQKIKETEE